LFNHFLTRSTLENDKEFFSMKNLISQLGDRNINNFDDNSKGSFRSSQEPHKFKLVLSDIPKEIHYQAGLHILECGESREQKCKLNTDS